MIERIKTAYLKGELSSDAAALLGLLAGRALGVRRLAEQYNFAPWSKDADEADALFEEAWHLVWHEAE